MRGFTVDLGRSMASSTQFDQPALHQRAERASGDIQLAQLFNFEFAAGAGKRIDNQSLIGIQFWLRRRFRCVPWADLEGRPHTDLIV